MRSRDRERSSRWVTRCREVDNSLLALASQAGAVNVKGVNVKDCGTSKAARGSCRAVEHRWVAAIVEFIQC